MIVRSPVLPAAFALLCLASGPATASPAPSPGPGVADLIFEPAPPSAAPSPSAPPSPSPEAETETEPEPEVEAVPSSTAPPPRPSATPVASGSRARPAARPARPGRARKAGSLSISVPASANLGTTAPGGSISGRLGPVQVTDTRGLLAVWTATVSTTAFTTGTPQNLQTIGTDRVSYWSGPATDGSGIALLSAGQATPAQAVTLSSPRRAFSLPLGALNTSATWNPTLMISVPATAVSGLYTATITHSVA